MVIKQIILSGIHVAGHSNTFAQFYYEAVSYYDISAFE
jgi:hypothetical protein